MRLIERLAEHRVGAIALTRIEKIAARIGIDETKLLELYVKTKNLVSKTKFAETPFTQRILLLPQCLRSRDCEASLGEYGYACKKCGRCRLQQVISKTLELGYKGVFIISGGSIVSKILRKERPWACVGVACLKELVLGSFVCEKFGTMSHCIPLLRDGCVETDVDWKVLYGAISMSLSNV